MRGFLTNNLAYSKGGYFYYFKGKMIDNTKEKGYSNSV